MLKPEAISTIDMLLLLLKIAGPAIVIYLVGRTALKVKIAPSNKPINSNEENTRKLFKEELYHKNHPINAYRPDNIFHQDE